MVGLVHPLVIERSAFDPDTLDDYGQPTATTSQIEVRGLVQPRAYREADDSRSAGPELGTHVIFLPLMEVEPADVIVKDGRRYAVQGVRRFDFGRIPHLEVDAQLVTAQPLAVGS